MGRLPMPMPLIQPTAASPAIDVKHVMIAEPNRIYAESLSRICAEVFPAAQTRVRCRAREALDALDQQPADVLLQGLLFEDMDGVDFLNLANATGLARHTLVISARWEEHMLVSLRSARFHGAVDTASESIEAVQQALRAIVQDECYISTALRPYLIDELPGENRVRELTQAELRVLQVIGNGSDNQEAAEELGLSVATVQTHRRNIMRKLRVSTSAKLVREAVRLGVVRIAPVATLQRPRRLIFPR